MDRAQIEREIEAGEQIQNACFRVLSTAPYLSAPLIKLLLRSENEWNENAAYLWSEPSFLVMTGKLQTMNGIGLSDTHDFHFIRKERSWLHAELRDTNYTAFVRLHNLLYQIASGIDIRFTDLVVPHYLRTTLGAAYHGSYVDEKIGLEYYKLLLALHRLDPSPEVTICSQTGLVWEAGHLLREQKSFGLFKDEPVTDEIVGIAATL